MYTIRISPQQLTALEIVARETSRLIAGIALKASLNMVLIYFVPAKFLLKPSQMQSIQTDRFKLVHLSIYTESQ